MSICKLEIGNFEQEKVRDRNKSIQIFKILNDKSDLIDLNALRSVSFTGVPQVFDDKNQGGDLRSIVW